MNLLKTAKEYHDQNLQVIPLQQNKKTPKAKWKKYQTTPQTDSHIENLFYDYTGNIGIIGGAVSDNFFVLDFDSIEKFKYMRPKIEYILNNTPVVRTSRGVHVYLKYHETLKSMKFDQLDIKGHGGYVVAPPSLHPDGTQYTFWDSFSQIMRVDDIEKLQHELNLQLQQTIITPEQSHLIKPYGISWKFWKLLRSGVEKGYRSESEQAIITYLIRNGWKFDDIFNLFFKFCTFKLWI